MADFGPAFRFLLPHEGGYVNDLDDDGGETKYGISKRQYPTLDIANLTQEDAASIYQRDYWNSQPYCYIQDQNVANKVFDLAVNMGFKKAHEILQRSANECGARIVVDGRLGPLSLQAVNSVDPSALLEQMRQFAGRYYLEIVARNPAKQKFLNGWMKRANA